MVAKYFISGTDTDVGKTFIASALLAGAKAQGYATLGMKPIAAGCEETPQGMQNEDALNLQKHASIELPYQQINPIALKPAIAPHIALQEAGKKVSVSQLAGFCRGVLMKKADLTLIEGAGGWRVPLNQRETLADLAKELQLPVILVVGLRLGCINHAILSAEAIQRDGLPLVAWVGNTLDAEMSCLSENIDTLKALMPAPCLGIMPRLVGSDACDAAQYLDFKTLV